MLYDEKRTEVCGPFRFEIKWKPDDDSDTEFIGKYIFRWADVEYPFYWRKEDVIFFDPPTDRVLSPEDQEKLDWLEDQDELNPDGESELQRLQDLANEVVFVGYDENGYKEEYDYDDVIGGRYYRDAAYIGELAGGGVLKDWFTADEIAAMDDPYSELAKKLHPSAGRLEGLNDQQWWFVGCIVTAYVEDEEVASASLWSIECDCGAGYQLEVENDLIRECLYDIKKSQVSLAERAAEMRATADKLVFLSETAGSLLDAR